jgi:hypothetical protein
VLHLPGVERGHGDRERSGAAPAALPAQLAVTDRLRRRKRPVQPRDGSADLAGRGRGRQRTHGVAAAVLREVPEDFGRSTIRPTFQASRPRRSTSSPSCWAIAQGIGYHGRPAFRLPIVFPRFEAARTALYGRQPDQDATQAMHVDALQRLVKPGDRQSAPPHPAGAAHTGGGSGHRRVRRAAAQRGRRSPHPVDQRLPLPAPAHGALGPQEVVRRPAAAHRPGMSSPSCASGTARARRTHGNCSRRCGRTSTPTTAASGGSTQRAGQ